MSMTTNEQLNYIQAKELLIYDCDLYYCDSQSKLEDRSCDNLFSYLGIYNSEPERPYRLIKQFSYQEWDDGSYVEIFETETAIGTIYILGIVNDHSIFSSLEQALKCFEEEKQIIIDCYDDIDENCIVDLDRLEEFGLAPSKEADELIPVNNIDYQPSYYDNLDKHIAPSVLSEIEATRDLLKDNYDRVSKNIFISDDSAVVLKTMVKTTNEREVESLSLKKSMYNLLKDKKVTVYIFQRNCFRSKSNNHLHTINDVEIIPTGSYRCKRSNILRYKIAS